MIKSVSPTAIGVFVIGAIILIVVAVLLFSSGTYFTRSHTIVAVFPGSVKGLTEGASVEMRGVRIGRVKSIHVLTDVKTQTITVPVYLEIVDNTMKNMSFQKISENMLSHTEWKEEVQTMINGGLRGQLILKSLVTGQLIVDIDFHPNTPINLTDIDSDFLELPTIERTSDRMLNILESLPLEDFVEKAFSVLDSFDQLMRSQELKDTLHNVNLVTNDAHQLLTNLNRQVEPLSTSARTTLTDISSMARQIDKQVQPLSESTIDTLNEAQSALASIEDMVGKDSATRADLEKALRELSRAAYSLRTLTDYLEQHPEALIRGKGY